MRKIRLVKTHGATTPKQPLTEAEMQRYFKSRRSGGSEGGGTCLDTGIEYDRSIESYEVFRPALMDYIAWRNTANNFPILSLEDEHSPAYKQLIKTESAAWDALIRVIDTYCEYQKMQAFLASED